MQDSQGNTLYIGDRVKYIHTGTPKILEYSVEYIIRDGINNWVNGILLEGLTWGYSTEWFLKVNNTITKQTNKPEWF